MTFLVKILRKWNWTLLRSILTPMKAIQRITVVIALFVTCIHVTRPNMIRNRFGILKVGEKRLGAKL